MTILKFNKKLTLILRNMKINKNKFKKVIFVSIVGVILSFLTFLNFKAGYLEDISPIFFWVIPILTGVFATIVQKEDRVRGILPSLVTVAFVYSFLLIFIFKLYIFVDERIGYTILTNYLKPFKGWYDVIIHMVLFGIVFFGGLIGMVVIGINEKLSRHGIRINLNFSFSVSFILGSIFILVANAYYIFVSVPPDGRWKIQFPLTSFFVMFYLVLFFFISRKLLKNPKYNYLLWTYNLLLAFLLLGNCGGVQQSFRHVEFMYAFQYISMAPYLVMLGAGIVVYALLLSYLENGRKFREVILNRKIIISFVMVFIFFLGVAMPKVMNFDSLQDSVQKNYYARLENAYASQQAHIFFDNPFERMFIMKTVVTDISPDTKRLIVSAYTFFNFKYKTIEIERVSEEAMARMLGREFKQKISRIGKDIPEILKRIQHSQWPCVTYSELIKNNYFSPEKIQGIIPGINNTNSLFLQTDFNEHEVYLLVYLEDLYTNTMKKDFAFKNGESRLEYIYKFKDIKISKANQIATLYSYRIEYDGHPYYIIFDVISDQEMPADVDYIWRPDHNIKDDDIEQVLRSIAGLLKEYFDDNLKMSFEYPNNFYIENGSIGSNFDIVVTPFTPDNPDYNNPNIVK